MARQQVERSSAKWRRGAYNYDALTNIFAGELVENIPGTADPLLRPAPAHTAGTAKRGTSLGMTARCAFSPGVKPTRAGPVAAKR